MDEKKRAENLFEALGDVSEELLAECEGPVRRRTSYKKVLAAAAVIALCILGAMPFATLYTTKDKPILGKVGKESAMQSPKKWLTDFGEEPDTVIEEEENNDAKKKPSEKTEANENEGSLKFTVPETDASNNGDDKMTMVAAKTYEKSAYTDWVQGLYGSSSENMVYSPVSLSMEMAMVAELSEDESRQEILDAMGMEQMESLSDLQHRINKQIKKSTGAVSLRCANALWLRNDWSYDKQKLSEAAGTYHTTSFTGKMGTASYNAKYQAWLNEKTENLLAKEASSEKLANSTKIGVSTTLYYQANWKNAMQRGARQTFYGKSGEKKVTMLCGGSKYATYRGKHFTAVAIPLADGRRFYVFLPDEGHSVAEVYGEAKRNEILSGTAQGEKKRLNLMLPCFTITESRNMIPVMKELGISKIFTADADFGGFVQEQKARISKLNQAVGIRVDENGITARAQRVEQTLQISSTMNETDEFIVNRPFGFAIADKDGVVYFEGVKLN